ncbi:hypothetical protein [Agriterribacter sp.]|uniref:hypothetical protein n=1 Tax=Agriterribacter sp. TaxID=2821509 RepID=UPI002CBB549F|nr:hypothetical protein [Agriterribacter sp.]HTN08811.1 hypothetical protein [Agriterribacter sp.]
MSKLMFFVSIFVLFSCNQGPDKSRDAAKPVHSPSSVKVEKSFISFRIGPDQSLPEKRFNELIDLFDKYKGVTDDITFFSSVTHAPLPLDVFESRIKTIKDRMALARKRGYRTGVNILTTIGHHNEDLPHSLKGDYTNMTGINGNISQGAFCPNDAKMQEYISAIYKITADSDPDYIWIDDDVRMGHMEIGYGCFCDNCLKIFKDESGIQYTRESILKAFNEGLVKDKLKVRNEWLQHNRNTISRLFKLIEKTVHEVNPNISLGFMTGDRFFEGYDFSNWAKILSGPNNTAVMWRPGGGFYQDNVTGELSGKSHDIGRQVSQLPDEVENIQSEIENFTYQRLKKAANIVVLEAASHIAAGSRGAAFNVLSFYDEPLTEYEPLLKKLQDARPFFDLMVNKFGRAKVQGVSALWNKDSYSSENMDGGNWLSGGNPAIEPEMYDIGIPASYAEDSARVILLNGSNVLTYSKKQLEEILSGSVYMSAEVLQLLNNMGLSHLTGFTVKNSKAVDCIEQFSDHFLNGSFAGSKRDNRQSFYKSLAYSLEKTDAKAEVLSYLTNYSDEDLGITMGVFENEKGGRICVSGYYPWSFMSNLSKSNQIKSVMRWLSKDTLPSYIKSFHKTNLWHRDLEGGNLALAITNASFDEAGDIEVMIRTNKKLIRVFDMKCKETVIPSSGTDGPYQKFIIPYVDAWQIRLVMCE